MNNENDADDLEGKESPDSSGSELPELSSVGPLDPTTIASQVTDEFDSRIIEKIGPYKILNEIGEGGMGCVYRAEQQHPVKRTVALKVIKAGRDSKQVIARFEAERQVLALMDHPTIARIIDAGETEFGQPYFAMELVRGVPLTTYCDDRSLGIEDRLSLFCQICDGIQHAHQKGIIHRDLKPGNILVTEYDGKPVPKIIDFGLAKALETTEKLTDKSIHTTFGQVLGTLRYMSPEQAGLDSLDVDTRSDIYTLGIILYELLTGSTPLDNKSIHKNALLKVLELVREQEVPRPSNRLSTDSQRLSTISSRRRIEPRRLNSILAGELDWIVMKSLDKDRNCRYPSASEFADDIRRFLNEEPVQARPPSTAYLLHKFVRKNKGLVASVAGVVFLLVAGITGTSLGFINANIERENAVQQQERTQTVLSIVANSFKVRPGDGNPVVAGRNMLASDVLTNMKSELETPAIDELVKSELYQAIITSMTGLGYYQQAVATGRQQLELNKRLFGADSEQAIRASTDLAVAYHKNGDREKALELDEQTFPLAKASLGESAFETLRSMTNLGVSLATSGKWDEATKLDEQALEIRTQQLGADDIETARSMNNLAIRYSKSDPPQWEKAIKLQEKALEIRKRKQGNEHPDTFIAMQNLARSYNKVKRKEDAIELAARTLELRTARLGNDHPQTLRTAVNLAAFEFQAGDKSAIERLESVLDQMLLVHPADHPDVIRTKNLLARCYVMVGRANGILDFDLRRLFQLAQQKGINITNVQTLAQQLTDRLKKSGELSKSEKLDSIFQQVRTAVADLQALVQPVDD